MSELPPPPTPAPRRTFAKWVAVVVLAAVFGGSTAIAVTVFLNRDSSSQPEQVATDATVAASVPESSLSPSTAPDYKGLNEDLTSLLDSVDAALRQLDRSTLDFGGRRAMLQNYWDLASEPGIDRERTLSAIVSSPPERYQSIDWFQTVDWFASDVRAARNDVVRFVPQSEGAGPLLEARDFILSHIDSQMVIFESFNQAVEAVKRDWQDPDDGSNPFTHYVGVFIGHASDDSDTAKRKFCDTALTLDQFFEVDQYNTRKIETLCT